MKEFAQEHPIITLFIVIVVCGSIVEIVEAIAGSCHTHHEVDHASAPVR
jgi:hypothetical protein